MTLPCKIDHTDPEALPVELCRQCHPELNRTGPQRAEAIASEKATQSVAVTRSTLLRKLGTARQKLGGAERAIARGGGSQGISVRVAKSMRTRIDRLERELAALSGEASV